MVELTKGVMDGLCVSLTTLLFTEPWVIHCDGVKGRSVDIP